MSLSWKRRTFLATLGSAVSTALLTKGWYSFPGVAPSKTLRFLPSVRIVGVGGAGCAVLDYLALLASETVGFVAVDSDLETLDRSLARTKVQIGRRLLSGLGGGCRPEIGYRAAVENLVDVTKELEGADLIIVSCGLAGGIGGGAAPVIAYAARVVCGAEARIVASAPVEAEGRKLRRNAHRASERLRWAADSVATVSFPEALVPHYSYEVSCFERTAEMAKRVVTERIRTRMRRYGRKRPHLASTPSGTEQ